MFLLHEKNWFSYTVFCTVEEEELATKNIWQLIVRHVREEITVFDSTVDETIDFKNKPFPDVI